MIPSLWIKAVLSIWSCQLSPDLTHKAVARRLPAWASTSLSLCWMPCRHIGKWSSPCPPHLSALLLTQGSPWHRRQSVTVVPEGGKLVVLTPSSLSDSLQFWKKLFTSPLLLLLAGRQKMEELDLNIMMRAPPCRKTQLREPPLHTHKKGRKGKKIFENN